MKYRINQRATGAFSEQFLKSVLYSINNSWTVSLDASVALLPEVQRAIVHGSWIMTIGL